MTILDQLEGLVSAKVGAVKALFSLIKLEARLAGLSVFPLIVNVCLIVVVLVSIWFSTMFLLGLCLAYYITNVFVAVFSVIFLNCIILIGLLKYLTYNVNSMSFAKTRAYFSNKEGAAYVKLEKEVNISN